MSMTLAEEANTQLESLLMEYMVEKRDSGIIKPGDTFVNFHPYWVMPAYGIEITEADKQFVKTMGDSILRYSLGASERQNIIKFADFVYYKIKSSDDQKDIEENKRYSLLEIMLKRKLCCFEGALLMKLFLDSTESIKNYYKGSNIINGLSDGYGHSWIELYTAEGAFIVDPTNGGLPHMCGDADSLSLNAMKPNFISEIRPNDSKYEKIKLYGVIFRKNNAMNNAKKIVPVGLREELDEEIRTLASQKKIMLPELANKLKEHILA